MALDPLQYTVHDLLQEAGLGTPEHWHKRGTISRRFAQELSDVRDQMEDHIVGLLEEKEDLLHESHGDITPSTVQHVQAIGDQILELQSKVQEVRKLIWEFRGISMASFKIEAELRVQAVKEANNTELTLRYLKTYNYHILIFAKYCEEKEEEQKLDINAES